MLQGLQKPWRTAVFRMRSPIMLPMQTVALAYCQRRVFHVRRSQPKLGFSWQPLALARVHLYPKPGGGVEVVSVAQRGVSVSISSTTPYRAICATIQMLADGTRQSAISQDDRSTNQDIGRSMKDIIFVLMVTRDLARSYAKALHQSQLDFPLPRALLQLICDPDHDPLEQLNTPVDVTLDAQLVVVGVELSLRLRRSQVP